MADDLNLTIQIQGASELIRKLGVATGNAVLIRPMERAVARLVSRLAKYPSPPPASSYKRTGNLGRNWYGRVTRAGSNASTSQLEGRVGNAVRGPRGQAYGPFVQGAKTQAGMHRGRWITDEQALNLETPAIERDFKDAIDGALK